MSFLHQKKQLANGTSPPSSPLGVYISSLDDLAENLEDDTVSLASDCTNVDQLIEFESEYRNYLEEFSKQFNLKPLNFSQVKKVEKKGLSSTLQNTVNKLFDSIVLLTGVQDRITAVIKCILSGNCKPAQISDEYKNAKAITQVKVETMESDFMASMADRNSSEEHYIDLIIIYNGKLIESIQKVRQQQEFLSVLFQRAQKEDVEEAKALPSSDVLPHSIVSQIDQSDVNPFLFQYKKEEYLDFFNSIIQHFFDSLGLLLLSSRGVAGFVSGHFVDKQEIATLTQSFEQSASQLSKQNQEENKIQLIFILSNTLSIASQFLYKKVSKTINPNNFEFSVSKYHQKTLRLNKKLLSTIGAHQAHFDEERPSYNKEIDSNLLKAHIKYQEEFRKLTIFIAELESFHENEGTEVSEIIQTLQELIQEIRDNIQKLSEWRQQLSLAKRLLQYEEAVKNNQRLENIETRIQHYESELNGLLRDQELLNSKKQDLENEVQLSKSDKYKDYLEKEIDLINEELASIQKCYNALTIFKTTLYDQFSESRATDGQEGIKQRLTEIYFSPTSLRLTPEKELQYSLGSLINRLVSTGFREQDNSLEWRCLLQGLYVALDHQPSFLQRVYHNPIELVVTVCATFAYQNGFEIIPEEIASTEEGELKIAGNIYCQLIHHLGSFREKFSPESIQNRRHTLSRPIQTKSYKAWDQHGYDDFLTFTRTFIAQQDTLLGRLTYDDSESDTSLQNPFIRILTVYRVYLYSTEIRKMFSRKNRELVINSKKGLYKLANYRKEQNLPQTTIEDWVVHSKDDDFLNETHLGIASAKDYQGMNVVNMMSILMLYLVTKRIFSTSAQFSEHSTSIKNIIRASHKLFMQHLTVTNKDCIVTVTNHPKDLAIIRALYINYYFFVTQDPPIPSMSSFSSPSKSRRILSIHQIKGSIDLESFATNALKDIGTRLTTLAIVTSPVLTPPAIKLSVPLPTIPLPNPKLPDTYLLKSSEETIGSYRECLKEKHNVLLRHIEATLSLMGEISVEAIQSIINAILKNIVSNKFLSLFNHSGIQLVILVNQLNITNAQLEALQDLPDTDLVNDHLETTFKFMSPSASTTDLINALGPIKDTLSELEVVQYLLQSFQSMQQYSQGKPLSQLQTQSMVAPIYHVALTPNSSVTIDAKTGAGKTLTAQIASATILGVLKVIPSIESYSATRFIFVSPYQVNISGFSRLTTISPSTFPEKTSITTQQLHLLVTEITRETTSQKKEEWQQLLKNTVFILDENPDHSYFIPGTFEFIYSAYPHIFQRSVYISATQCKGALEQELSFLQFQQKFNQEAHLLDNIQKASKKVKQAMQTQETTLDLLRNHTQLISFQYDTTIEVLLQEVIIRYNAELPPGSISSIVLPDVPHQQFQNSIRLVSQENVVVLYLNHDGILAMQFPDKTIQELSNVEDALSLLEKTEYQLTCVYLTNSVGGDYGSASSQYSQNTIILLSEEHYLSSLTQYYGRHRGQYISASGEVICQPVLIYPGKDSLQDVEMSLLEKEATFTRNVQHLKVSKELHKTYKKFIEDIVYFLLKPNSYGELASIYNAIIQPNLSNIIYHIQRILIDKSSESQLTIDSAIRTITTEVRSQIEAIFANQLAILKIKCASDTKNAITEYLNTLSKDEAFPDFSEDTKVLDYLLPLLTENFTIPTATILNINVTIPTELSAEHAKVKSQLERTPRNKSLLKQEKLLQSQIDTEKRREKSFKRSQRRSLVAFMIKSTQKTQSTITKVRHRGLSLASIIQYFFQFVITDPNLFQNIPKEAHFKSFFLGMRKIQISLSKPQFIPISIYWKLFVANVMSHKAISDEIKDEIERYQPNTDVTNLIISLTKHLNQHEEITIPETLETIFEKIHCSVMDQAQTLVQKLLFYIFQKLFTHQTDCTRRQKPYHFHTLSIAPSMIRVGSCPQHIPACIYSKFNNTESVEAQKTLVLTYLETQSLNNPFKNIKVEHIRRYLEFLLSQMQDIKKSHTESKNGAGSDGGSDSSDEGKDDAGSARKGSSRSSHSSSGSKTYKSAGSRSQSSSSKRSHATGASSSGAAGKSSRRARDAEKESKDPVVITAPPTTIQNGSLVGKFTEARGDCSFHAVFGTPLNGKYQIPGSYEDGLTQLQIKRNHLGNTVKKAAPDSPLGKLRTEGIKDLVMRGSRISGLANLTAAYQGSLVPAEAIPEIWITFQSALEQYPDIITFIRENHSLGEGDHSIRAMFENINANTNKLLAILQAIPELNQAWTTFNHNINPGFNWEAHITDEVIEGYSNYLATVGNWLLPLEVHMMALAFDTPIDFYTTTPKGELQKVGTFNPTGTKPKVTIRFNGRDHYERIEVATVDAEESNFVFSPNVTVRRSSRR